MGIGMCVVTNAWLLFGNPSVLFSPFAEVRAKGGNGKPAIVRKGVLCIIYACIYVVDCSGVTCVIDGDAALIERKIKRGEQYFVYF